MQINNLLLNQVALSSLFYSHFSYLDQEAAVPALKAALIELDRKAVSLMN